MGAWGSWIGCQWRGTVGTIATLTRLPPVFATQPSHFADDGRQIVLQPVLLQVLSHLRQALVSCLTLSVPRRMSGRIVSYRCWRVRWDTS
jgi:hypothetical protein